MNELVITILTYLVAPIATVAITTFFNKRKYKAEANQSELGNVEQAVKIWRETAERLEEMLASRELSEKELKEELSFIKSQNAELLIKFTHLERDYSKLQRNYNDLKTRLSK